MKPWNKHFHLPGLALLASAALALGACDQVALETFDPSLYVIGSAIGPNPGGPDRVGGG